MKTYNFIFRNECLNIHLARLDSFSLRNNKKHTLSIDACSLERGLTSR